MQPDKPERTGILLEKAGVPDFCNSVLEFRKHKGSSNQQISKDSPLLPIYKDIGETKSLYSFYIEYCKQNNIQHAGKIKFGRELNSFFKTVYDSERLKKTRVLKNRELFLKDLSIRNN